MIECPFCGTEIEPYEDLEEDDIEEYIVQDFTHSRDSECERGCERWSNQYYCIPCKNCDEVFDVLEVYVQPCNANGYAVDITAYKQVPDDVYREHLHKST